MNYFKRVPLMVLTLGLVSCASLISPSPATSERFKTYGGGFKINKEKKIIRYSLVLAVIHPFEKDVFVEFRFQNPENKSDPLIQNKILKPGARKFIAESDPIRGLKAHRNYMVDVLVFDDQEKTNLIARHTQYIQSLVNQHLLEGW